jgi:hypothetical protein
MNGLNASRPLAERQEIVDRYYDRYEALVRLTPDDHAMDYVHVYMIVSKRG